VQITSHGEMNTPTTTAPATARRQNPHDITTQSRIIMRLSTSEYIVIITMYTVMIIPNVLVNSKLPTSATTAQVIASTAALPTLTVPAAIGLLRFVGCSLSVLRSTMSLKMYIADAAMLKQKNAPAALPTATSTSLAGPNTFCPNINAANTNVFFVQ
jgi:hypothetical protein